MRVLTYVDSIITIINGEQFYSSIHEKPSFITGENFYYEPILKMMDNVELSQEIQAEAELFIETYQFPKLVHCVNSLGEYLGDKYIEIGEVGVLSAPPVDGSHYLYDFIKNVWFKTVVVNRDGYCVSLSTTTNDEESYIKEALLLDSDITWQKFNFKTNLFEIDINIARSSKLYELDSVFIQKINGMIGSVCYGEMDSWTEQEVEARAWVLDNTTQTPFIDALLIGRNMGETKAILIDKIITKADAYKTFYGQELGKLHSKQKLIEEATTAEELKAIVW